MTNTWHFWQYIFFDHDSLFTEEAILTLDTACNIGVVWLEHFVVVGVSAWIQMDCSEIIAAALDVELWVKYAAECS